MDRLTNADGIWRTPIDSETVNKLYKRLASYEDTGLTPDEVDQIRRASLTMMFPTVGDFVRYAIQNFEDLEKYRKAETEGRLIVLPCEVGDTVWVLGGHSIYKGRLQTFRVTGRGLVADAEYQLFGLCAGSFLWGKDAFFTREEAEAALEKEET